MAVPPHNPPGHFGQAARHGEAVLELTGRPVVAQLFGGPPNLARGQAEEWLEEEYRLQDAQDGQPDRVAAEMVRNLVAEERAEL